MSKENIARISNKLLEAFIKRNNLISLKLISYIAKNKIINKNEYEYIENENLYEIKINIKKMCEYCNINRKTLQRNIKKITETSVNIKREEKEQYINIIPFAEIDYTGYIRVKIFGIILKMVNEITKYSIVDIKTLSKLKSKHSIRMFLLLERINNFSKNVCKVKEYTLEELNNMFDTNYKTFTEFERAVLKKAQTELNEKSKITFEYNKILESDKTGRPEIKKIRIELIKRKNLIESK